MGCRLMSWFAMAVMSGNAAQGAVWFWRVQPVLLRMERPVESVGLSYCLGSL